MIEVRAIGPELEAGYARFVQGQPDGLLYHSLPYRDLLVGLLDAEAEYLVALAGGEIRAALPIMWAERDGVRVANSLPYYGSHGSLLGRDEAARDALLAAWDERATDPSTAAATLVTNPFSGGLSALPAHDLTDERINQATALPAAAADVEGQVLELIDSSARRNVRKALRLGTEAMPDHAAMDDLCRIHHANMADIGGRAKDPAFFASVARHFRAGEEYDVYTARLDGKVVAALLVFWFGTTAEYFTPAVDHDHRSDQPLAAVLARALGDAVRRGARWFNWGGTWLTQDGVYRFKRKWGARDVRYPYFVKLNDRSLLDATPAELRDTFGDFYVVPFSALRAEGVSS